MKYVEIKIEIVPENNGRKVSFVLTADHPIDLASGTRALSNLIKQTIKDNNLDPMNVLASPQDIVVRDHENFGN